MAKRVFEPFFTTKPQGVGTGVGLSVCHGIVAAHGGRIELDTARGEGARFRVHLPLSHDAEAVRPRRRRRRSAGGGRVLVVDDEPEIAALLAERLRRRRADGRDRRRAAGGRWRALEAGGVDAVVSDLRMPDMDGRGARRTRSAGAGPALAGRIVLITGDALGADPGGRLGARGLPIFEKPLDLAALRGRAAPPHRRGGGAMTGRARILVVDDEPDLRALLEDYLGMQGFAVGAAADAAELDARLAEAPADVIVLDVNMPGENGLAGAGAAARRRRAGPG